jgi:hypothetical protein
VRKLLLLPLLLAAFACASRPAVARKPVAVRPADQLHMRTPEQIAGPETRELGKLEPVQGAAKTVEE